MAFFLTFGIIILLPGLFFLFLAFKGRNPQNLINVPGELTQRKGFKNIRIKTYTVKNLTDYAYSYEVNGKQYVLKGTQWTHPRKLFKKVSIIYLRGFPRVAYIEHFTGACE